MGVIFVLTGKSASGKDTIFKALTTEVIPFFELEVEPIVLFTTRPQRVGEKEGREYFFITDEEADQLEEQNKVIERRRYNVYQPSGTIKERSYMLVDEGIDLEKTNYLVLSAPSAIQDMRARFGKRAIVPIYINVEDGERLIRSIMREQQQSQPRYIEVCRRFIADTSDFLGFTAYTVENDNIGECSRNIANFMSNIIEDRKKKEIQNLPEPPESSLVVLD